MLQMQLHLPSLSNGIFDPQAPKLLDGETAFLLNALLTHFLHSRIAARVLIVGGPWQTGRACHGMTVHEGCHLQSLSGENKRWATKYFVEAWADEL